MPLVRFRPRQAGFGVPAVGLLLRGSPAPCLWTCVEGGPNEGRAFPGPISPVGGCDFYIRLTSILI